MKKVCAITATRAEYGLLKWVMTYLNESKDIQLQIIVTGTHLSPEHGYTINQIIGDGFHVDKKVDMLLSSNSSSALAKAMGLCSISFADAFNDLQPDLIVVLGDRYEMMPICSAALVMRIPIAHISGGDVTEGAIDDKVRNSLTMMADLHFPGTKESANNIERMRGDNANVFCVGEPGLDNFRLYNLMSRKELAESLDIDLNKSWFLITVHPETMEAKEYNLQMARNVIEAVSEIPNAQTVISSANADMYGNEINSLFKEYCSSHRDSFRFYCSLGQRRYLSFMKQVNCIIGNSSSGIQEAPCLGKPVVNIGNRQKGRHLCTNIIQVDNKLQSLKIALRSIKGDVTPDNYWGDGHTSERIAKFIIEYVTTK